MPPNSSRVNAQIRIGILPTMVAYILLQWYLIFDLTAGALKERCRGS